MDSMNQNTETPPVDVSTSWQQITSPPPPPPRSMTTTPTKPTPPGDTRTHGLIFPVVTAGVSLLFLLCIVAIIYILRKRRRNNMHDKYGPSIVVYPSRHGSNPQFLSREILFSLPTLRHSNSVNDLGAAAGNNSEDTECLVAPSRTHSQRSNSFSCYGLGAIDPALYRAPGTELEEELPFPEEHLGRLWFTIRYEAATEKLLVSILKAKNLPSRTMGTVNGCDPFVRLNLVPDERRKLQSKTKKKTCNPFFDETFVFQVAAKQLLDHILKLTVIDSGRPKHRGIIGHVSLPLNDFVNETEQKLFKMDLVKEGQDVVNCDLGEILVSLLYNDALQRLSVIVIEGKKLKLKEGEKQDSYVKVTLNQNYRPIKTKKTSTVKGKVDPNFSECFNFKVSSDDSDISSLTFQVCQAVGGYGRDKVIGKFVLGSHMFARGKANIHWTSAFSTPKEAFQQWHALCG